MTYPESVQLLYSLGNEVATAKLGLDEMRVLLESLARPHLAGSFIHVAGTNGKGSTCAMIESTLRAAGVKTGLYTSPHLNEPPERIRINGRIVDSEIFAAACDRVHKTAERLMRDGALERHPTYFETITAMAFLLFKDYRVRTAVIEVGLGGRLDATNVITPRLSVITPIDFDHERFLGRSIEAIAAEKAGILKPGVPAVFSRQRPEAIPVLQEAAEAAGITPVWASSWCVEDLSLHASGSSFRAVAGGRDIRIECPLAGEHQVDNAVTAVAAMDALGFSADVISAGIRKASWPGRLERVAAGPDIILDGAHNPASARVLAAHIQRFYSDRRVWLIYGAMRDKAVTEVAGILFPVASELILTAPNMRRAVHPEAVLPFADHPRARTAPGIEQALEMIRDASPDDVIFITGSLFLVGEARALLVK